MLITLCIALFAPLLGFLLLMISANRIGRMATGYIACSTVFISFICFAALLYHYVFNDLDPHTFILYQWIPVKGLLTDFALHLDPLSLLMTLIISGIGFLIHVYSNGYMDHDEDYARYFACLNFFIFAMLLLVLAANLLLLFVGWEGVGLASYLLIGFWYKRPAAAEAATKAFVVNRIGDFGLLVGILLTYTTFGTSTIDTLSNEASKVFAIGAPLVTLLTLLYFWGAIGKSAQLPLYTWLPDAMEGPTPVSALIHAATMVTAGVYLVVRMHDVFMLAPTTLYVVGTVGGITAIFAALCALAQTDLKRVLAYSTISQLGLMFLTCGIGAYYAAMFHLTTHAFVKALLFLTAGNVVHMLHGTTEMANMGGLRKKFPITHWLFLIGILAMSGVPPFAAFFSKDLILEQEHLAGYDLMFALGLLTSILTAFYLTRAYCLTFTGPSHLSKELEEEVHEAPKIMLVPELILAFFAIVGGYLGFTFGKRPMLQAFLDEVGITLREDVGSNYVFTFETLLSIIGAAFGIGLAAIVYTRFTNKLGPTLAFLKRSFYVDDIYSFFIVKPLKELSKYIAFNVEPKIFDQSINMSSQSMNGTATLLQKMQSGQIRSYIAWLIAGSALLIVYFTLLRNLHA